MALAQESNDEVGIWSEIGVEKAITKKWAVGLDVEYRAQDRSRFSAGIGTSYKLNKYLKFGISYSFLNSYRPDKYKTKNNLTEKIAELGLLEEHLQDPDNLEFYPDKWKVGYNHTPDYWYPRHRFSAEATGSIKLWNWLKISLRERYQLTYCKARTVSQYKYRDVYEKEEYMEWNFPTPTTGDDDSGDDSGGTSDDPWDWGDWGDWGDSDDSGDSGDSDDSGGGTAIEPTITRTANKTGTEEEWVQEVKPAYTDQVLRSRIKFEFDKKRCPFSPFISAEFHNSVRKGDHMLLQKIRAAVGTTYKFRKHNEVSLAYTITFDIYDTEETEVVRLHDRRHAICIGYKYSF